VNGPRHVRLLVCGNADRGDDGAALEAVAGLLGGLPGSLRAVLEVRRCEALQLEDLLELPDQTVCVIVDTAIGLPPGSVVTIPLAELPARDAAAGPVPRSSHVLPIGQLVAIASVMRGPVEGSFVAVGGRSFGFGRGLGRPVRAALPDVRAAIKSALFDAAGPLIETDPDAQGAERPGGGRAERPIGSVALSLPDGSPVRHAGTMNEPDAAPYPGLPAIVDGSEAIAHVETRISEVACVYPITPSTTMAALFQSAVAGGARNLWGTPLQFIEPESEHSSASAAEGAALAGGRVTNFTAGQGLVLMKEVLYVISGKRLPAVFHVGARALTSQALNIHAGHDDVMAVADTGWGILFARNAQEAADLTAIARRVAESTDTPFMVAQDGFLTTHTLENVRLPEDELLQTFVGDPADRIRDLFDPAEALMTGVVQNQDSYMKGRIGQRAYTDQIPSVLADAMAEWTTLTGRPIGLIEPYRCGGASEILVSMGTMADTAIAVVDHLRSQGRPVGCVAVTSFRPFPNEALAAVLRRARAVGVVERTDDPLAAANPLTREVRSALYDAAAEGVMVPRVLSFSAGLGSRDIAAGDLIAAFDRLALHSEPESRHFVLGIRHPLALERVPIDLRPPGSWSLRGHSIGGFGSVTTNKLVATLSGELFDKFVQAYPRYGSEKKGLPTTYFLTIADAPIRLHAELDQVDFVPLHDVSAFALGDPLAGLVDGGTIFLQSRFVDPDTIWRSIPAAVRAELVARRIRITALDTAALAAAHAPTPDLLIRMQGVAMVGVFLRVSPFAARAGMDRDTLLSAVKDRLARFFGKRGGAVVDANLAVIEAAYDGLIDVSAALDLPADDPLAGPAASPEPEGAAR
jgi:pyruvate-ferredoxin/flavodoxin oxidoreductase